MSLKTQKAVMKRFRITKSGKIMQKRKGQDHFNAREPSKVTRNKRRLFTLAKTEQRTIKQLLPYS